MGHNIYKKQTSSIIVHDISDHLPCLMVLPGCKTREDKSCLDYKQNFTEKKVDELKQALSNITWSEKLCDCNTE